MALNGIPQKTGLFKEKDVPVYKTTLLGVNYDVYEFQGRYFLQSEGYSLAEIIQGYHTLEKKYKGSFDNWIMAIRDKDIEKIEKAKLLIAEIKKDMHLIKDVHKFKD
jgi:hypothetical protein